MAVALDDAMLSTDLSDYLTRQGVPFRESHQVVGRAVRRAEKLGVSLKDLDPAEYQAIHPAFTEDVYEVFDFQRSVGARDTEGATAPDAIRVQIQRARKHFKTN